MRHLGATLACAAVLVSGCSQPGPRAAAPKTRTEHELAAPARALPQPATPTASRDLLGRGGGIALNEAPPQRRFLLVREIAPGGGGRVQMHAVAEMHASDLMPLEGMELPIPEPPPLDLGPDDRGPPPIIPIPPPH